jgi:hypothetical protein
MVKKTGANDLMFNKIKKIFSLVAISLLILFVIGCANKSYVKKDSSFTPEGWKKIVVFPFTGTRGFTYLAAEAFTFHIKAKEHFEIVPPKTVYALIEKMKIPAADNLISIEYAKKVAEQLNAQVMIMGNIETIKEGKSFDAIATIKVIDIKTGKTVTESHRPSGLKVKNSEEQCVIISVGNASVDINEFLVEAARKNKTGNEAKPVDKKEKTSKNKKAK